MINDGEITVVKASKRNNEKHEKMRNSQRKGKGKRRSGVSSRLQKHFPEMKRRQKEDEARQLIRVGMGAIYDVSK